MHGPSACSPGQHSAPWGMKRAPMSASTMSSMLPVSRPSAAEALQVRPVRQPAQQKRSQGTLEGLLKYAVVAEVKLSWVHRDVSDDLAPDKLLRLARCSTDGATTSVSPG